MYLLILVRHIDWIKGSLHGVPHLGPHLCDLLLDVVGSPHLAWRELFAGQAHVVLRLGLLELLLQTSDFVNQMLIAVVDRMESGVGNHHRPELVVALVRSLLSALQTRKDPGNELVIVVLLEVVLGDLELGVSV